MKNLIVSLAVALATGTTPALAHGANNDPSTEKVFARQFAGAQNVKWRELEDGYRQVLFTLNGTGIEAFYDQDAELLGTIRVLFFNQLPLRVIQTMESKFAKAVIIEVKEIATAEGTHYKILAEQNDKRYNLRISSLGDVLEKEKAGSKK
ncbi:MAG: hypothetical protein Q8941_19420 [Bacteroidota bacterium]|nr:hypothetical protein [Bacteroidota bacterium]